MFDFLKKENRLNLTAFLISFFWLLAGAVFFIIPLYVIGPKVAGLSFSDYIQSTDIVMGHTYIISSIDHIFAITIFVIMFYKYIIDDFNKLKKNYLLTILLVVIGVGSMYGLNELMEVIYDALHIEGTSANQEGIIKVLHGDTKVFVLIYVSILAPIFEEIVFRKFFYNALKMNTKLPVWLIVIIISIVFAGIHVVSDIDSIKFFPQYFLSALILTIVYALSKENIFASISLHSLNNIIAAIQILV